MPQILISWIVAGVVAGLGIYLFSSRRLAGGVFGNLLAGVVGAFAGGALICYATGVDIGTDPATWGVLIVAFVSALVIGIIVQTQAVARNTN